MSSTLGGKKIVKIRYHLFFRWFEKRPREENVRLTDLPLPSEWKIKCRIPNSVIQFHRYL